MKKGIHLLGWLLFSFSLLAQTPGNHSGSSIFRTASPDLGWVEIVPEQRISAADFFATTHTLYGLPTADAMHLAQATSDELGWTHYRYHQYHQGVRVEGGTYILHARDGWVHKANGHIVPRVNIPVLPQLTRERAIERALAVHPAQRYRWENTRAEDHLRTARRDPNATYYPDPELVLVDRAYPQTTGDLVLAYKMIVYAEQPLARHQVWIDARTGQVVRSFNLLHGNTVEGTAMTRFHGEQTILTTQLSDGSFVLRDSLRDIVTYDATDDAIFDLDFFDDDNFWNNWNANQDEVATDAHWGAEVTYDFFLDHFNWLSYDNLGSPMLNYVHVGDRYNNAYWDGTSMNYGDGDSTRFYPLTALDVCGHEVAHGVTQNSADLVYAYESGALNESFSDIFGKSIEFLTLPATTNWIVGQRMLVDQDRPIRNMADPKSVEDPQSYLGEHWHTAPSDAGGVHSNSGVQNYWFYLLCTGEDGVNEAGEAYSVAAIGMDKALQIAFRNLTVYLTEDSNYPDARTGSLQAAADLYGFCSTEYLAVAAAWHAVDLGYPVQDGDYELVLDIREVSGCELPEVPVTARFLNNGCTEVLAAGTVVPLAYQLDDQPIVYDSLVLASDLLPGESVEFTFEQPILDPTVAQHTITVWSVLPDANLLSNTKELLLDNRPYQNEDFAMLNVFTFGQGICAQYNEEGMIDLFGNTQYLGCDSLSADTEVPYTMSYQYDISSSHFLFSPEEPGGRFFIFDFFSNVQPGFGYASFSVDYPGDPDPTNNEAQAFIAQLEAAQLGWTQSLSNDFYAATDVAGREQIDSRYAIQQVDGNERLLATGSTIFDEDGDLKVTIEEDAEDFFNSNRRFFNYIEVCLDVVGIEDPVLSFDLRQTHSTVDYASYEIPAGYQTMVGVLVDNELVGDLIYTTDPATAFNNFVFDLSAYADTTHRLQIVSLALTADYDAASGEYLMTGDNNIFDNLEITQANSVDDPRAAAPFTLFPNPSSATFTLRRPAEAHWAQARLTDATGRLVWQRELQNELAGFSFGEVLPAGVYFLQIGHATGTTTYKLVKQ